MTAPVHKPLWALFSLIAAISLSASGCAGTAETVRPGPGQFSTAPAQDVLNEASPPQAEQVVVVGDQFATGTVYGGSGPTNWAYDLQRLIGQAGIDAYVRNFGRIGTGYTPNTAVSTTFSDDVRRGVNPDTDLVIVFGGGNDIDSVPILRDAVIHTFEEVKAIAPNTEIIAVGPIWSSPEPPPGEILAANDAIKESSEEFGAQFINPIGDNWFTGRDDLRAEDGISPNDAAQPVIAERLSSSVIAALRGVESVTPELPTATSETSESGTTESPPPEAGEATTPPPGLPAPAGPPPGPQVPAGPP
jgi:lysophospholipase L1-like esterase